MRSQNMPEEKLVAPDILIEEYQNILEWFKEKDIEEELSKTKTNVFEYNIEKPETPKDYMTKLIANHDGEITLKTLNGMSPFNKPYTCIEDYLSGNKTIDNSVITGICKALSVSADEFINVKVKWDKYQSEIQNIQDKINNDISKEIQKLKKDYKSTTKKYIDCLDYKIKEVERAKKDTENYLQSCYIKENRKEELIKNLDTDKVLSEIVQNIGKYNKDDLIDKILSAKNGLITLVENQKSMYTFEQVREFKDKITQLQETQTMLSIISISSIIGVIMSLCIVFYLVK